MTLEHDEASMKLKGSERESCKDSTDVADGLYAEVHQLRKTQRAAPGARGELLEGDHLSFAPIDYGQTPNSASEKQSLERQRANLEKQIDALPSVETRDGKDAEQFKADMKSFEARAKAQGLSDKEVADTYSHIASMLEAAGEPLSQHQRARAAMDTMALAADPDLARQGGHNTCNATTLENRLFARQPAAAAGLIAQVAITGRYVAADGTTVDYNNELDRNSLEIHSEEQLAADSPRGDKYRDYASQLFQVTALNLLYAEDGGKLHYVQDDEDPPNHSSGEKVIDAATGEVTTDYKLQRGGSVKDVIDMNRMITGKAEPEAFLQHADLAGTEGKAGNVIEGEGDLKRKLEELKRNNQLPAIVPVDVGNEPFYSTTQICRRKDFEKQFEQIKKDDPDQYSEIMKMMSRLDTSPLGHGGHFVNITDYNPETGEIIYSNPNGDNLDKRASVHDFYNGMTPPKGTVWFDRLEQAHKDGIVTNDDYAKRLEEVASEVFKVAADQYRGEYPGTFDKQDLQKCVDRYSAALNTLSDEEKRSMSPEMALMYDKAQRMLKGLPPEPEHH